MRRAVTAMLLVLTLCGCGTLRDFKEARIRSKANKAHDAAFDVCSRGDQKTAELLLASFTQKYPNHQRLAFFRAVSSRSRWRKVEAQLQFLHVAGMNSASIEGRCARCILNLEAGRDPDGDFEKLQTLLEEAPGDPLLLWIAGVECREYHNRTDQKRYAEQGVRYFERLSGLFEKGPAVFHQTYANLLTEGLQRYDEALEHRYIAVELEPTGWTYQGLGNTLTDAGRYEEANEAFKKCLQLSPKDPDYWGSWGRCLFNWGKHEDAARKLNVALQYNPHDGAEWRLLGNCLSQMNRYADAIEYYDRADREGDSLAAEIAGEMYFFGKEGLEKDFAEAMKWYRRAVRHGSPTVMARIGWMYANGEGVAQDGQEALKWNTSAAERGNARAMASMAWMYQIGMGVEKDTEKAVGWGTRAAELGDVWAMSNLASTYFNGWGVEVDYAKALHWAARAAEHGDKDALLTIGQAYWHGRAVERDRDEATYWLLIAERMGDVAATAWLDGMGRARSEMVTKAEKRLAQEGGLKQVEGGRYAYAANLGKLLHVKPRPVGQLDIGKFGDPGKVVNLTYGIDATEPLGDSTFDCPTDNIVVTCTGTDPIVDITPVGVLTNLTTLRISRSGISDIAVLAGLTKLRVLDLGYSKVDNVEALAGLANLEYLCLKETPLSDIAPLKNLTGLKTLDLDENYVSDISVLSGMTNLEVLILKDLRLEDVDVLSALTKLTTLNLRGNKVTDLTPLIENAEQGGLGAGDSIVLTRNPLTDHAITNQIPLLREYGAEIIFDDPTKKP